MSLFGGIISGALQGAGDAGQQVAAQQAKVWDQEDINKQLADLDVQKQASLMALNFQNRMRYINGGNAPSPIAPAPVVTAPLPDSTVAQPISDQQPNTSAVPLPSTPAAIDPSQGWEGINAQYKAQQPQADAESLAMLQNEYKSEADPQNRAALERSMARLGGAPTVDSTIAPSPVPVNSSVSNNPQSQAPSAYILNPSTGVFEPSQALQMAALKAEMGNPGGSAEVYKNNQPTEVERLVAAQNRVGPTSPQGVVIGRQLDQLGYIAPIAARATLYDPVHGNVVFSPAVGGVQTQYKGKDAVGSTAIPGYGDAEGAIAAGKLAGENTQTVAPENSRPTDAQGRPIPVTTAQAIRNGASGQGAGNSPAQLSSIKSNDDAATVNAKLPDIAVKAKQTVSALEGALALAKTLPATGPGTVQQNKFWSQMENLVPGIKPGDNENNYQLMTKFLNNAQSNAAGATGADRSDQSAGQFGKGQANSETLNIAPLVKAIQYTASQQDAAIAKDQFIARTRASLAANGAANPDLLAQQAWSSTYDPKVFEFSRMDPADRAQLKANMMKTDPDAAAAFGAKYNQFHANGWVQ